MPLTTPPDAEPEPAYAALRRLLAGLGADDDLVSRVAPWADLGGRGYVYVPPLPAELVEYLVRMMPVASC
jgi:hypothetical protein